MQNNEKYRMGRGFLHPSKQAIAEKYRGKPITIREIRLCPYIQHCAVNGERMTRINEEEREIRQKLIEDGFIINQIGAPELSTKGRKFVGYVLQWAYEGY